MPSVTRQHQHAWSTNTIPSTRVSHLNSEADRPCTGKIVGRFEELSEPTLHKGRTSPDTRRELHHFNSYNSFEYEVLDLENLAPHSRSKSDGTLPKQQTSSSQPSGSLRPLWPYPVIQTDQTTFDDSSISPITRVVETSLITNAVSSRPDKKGHEVNIRERPRTPGVIESKLHQALQRNEKPSQMANARLPSSLNRLSIYSQQLSKSQIKTRQEAKEQQAVIHERLKRANEPIPPYEFQNYIGKGSYGRVYVA